MPIMKIRHPGLIKSLAMVGSVALRGWISTLSVHYRPLGPNIDPYQHGGLSERYIYTFWHEYMILLCRYARRNIHILISRHADGELIAQVCKHIGFSVVRGSTDARGTSKGGVEALWQMCRISERDHLVITPDGPRGPRRKVHPGLAYLASRTGLPIMPIGVGYERCWRMSSWDRFALPYPGSLACGVTAEPIYVPPEADRSELEVYCQRVEQQLLELGDLAEAYARSGRWPGTPYLLGQKNATKAVA
jgi:lysophospholipid acyltransferase (LPLAT)-like uncharacterized protein